MPYRADIAKYIAENSLSDAALGLVRGVEGQPLPYEGYGIIHKVVFKSSGMLIIVDINTRSPVDSQIQKLPYNQNCFTNTLEYAIFEQQFSTTRAKMTLEAFEMQTAIPSIEFLRNVIFSGRPEKPLANVMPPHDSIKGLPQDLSPSQKQAIEMAFKQRLSLIQGPPGTGKTLVVAALATHWIHSKTGDRDNKILICAPSNTAADFIADRLG
jgi:AAA domain